MLTRYAILPQQQFAYVKGKPGAGSVAAVVLAVVAGVVGFVGGLLTAAARIDSGEH